MDGVVTVVVVVVAVVGAASVVLRRLEMLIDLGSCRGEELRFVLGGLRGSWGAVGGRPLGIIDGDE